MGNHTHAGHFFVTTVLKIPVVSMHIAIWGHNGHFDVHTEISIDIHRERFLNLRSATTLSHDHLPPYL